MHRSRSCKGQLDEVLMNLYCPKNRKKRLFSAKKIGKNSRPAGTSWDFCFAEVLRALEKSVLDVFGKVLANAVCKVNIPCCFQHIGVELTWERVEDGNGHLNTGVPTCYWEGADLNH